MGWVGGSMILCRPVPRKRVPFLEKGVHLAIKGVWYTDINSCVQFQFRTRLGTGLLWDL